MAEIDKKKRNKILGTLFIGVLMAALDIAIVGPALPAIQKQFGIDERSVAWIFTIYVLFNLVSTPLMSKLSDIFGRRSIYIIDIILFAAGSIVVAASPNFAVLLTGRAIQGFGSGGIFPVASAVIGDTFPVEKRGGALGLIGAVFGIAFIVGPVIAGVILMFSWHWLFLVNIPISIAVIIMSMSTLPTTRQSKTAAFDWKGMAVLAILLAGLTYGINKIHTTEFLSSLLSVNVLPFLIIAALLLPVFKLLEGKASDPVLRMELFKSRQVILVSAIAIGAGISEATVVFVPPLIVAAFGVSTSTASFMLFPVVIAMALGSPLAGRMIDKKGSRFVLIIGGFLLTVGISGLAFLSSIVMFYVSAFIIGIGMGFLLGAPLRYIMLNESEENEKASAQGALTLFTGVGQLLGGALVGAVASSGGGGAAGLKLAFLFVAVVMFIIFILTFGLKKQREEQSFQPQQAPQN